MENRYTQLAVDIAETVAKKNSDYGAAFERSYRKYGWLSYIIRIDDKLNRLKTLAVNGKEGLVSSESIEDTLTDIIGYSLLMLEIQKRENDTGFELLIKALKEAYKEIDNGFAIENGDENGQKETEKSS